MILQQLYNISDEELEYQVNDRLSFMQFLDLTLEDVGAWVMQMGGKLVRSIGMDRAKTFRIEKLGL
jgi:Transposase domain (DUF772)